ncbi:MAG TPA: sulfur carrier protein ThiS [Bacteroidales bacterium]|nr:sulfur carrier protein ThiS [Bacteroidales bacterium]
MQVTINNNKYEIQEGTTLNNVLTIIGIQSDAGIALAVNSSVVTRTDWENYRLSNNDAILVIRAIQGG